MLSSAYGPSPKFSFIALAPSLMDSVVFDGGEAGEPVEEATHRRRRVTITASALFSVYGISQERHVVVILYVADCREEPLVELKHNALAVADGEDGSAGRDGSALLSDGEIQHSRLAGGVNYLHDLLSLSHLVVRNT